MYTLEEINKEAKSQAIKAFWKTFLSFGFGFPIAGLIIALIFAPSENMDMDAITGFLMSVFPMCIIGGFFGGAIFYISVSVGVKKKMKEENEQEELKKREEHYRKMEELLEKMAENKGNESKMIKE